LQVELTWVLNCPALQAAHFRSDVAVGAVVWALPAGQVVNAEHFLSEVAVAAVDSYWAAVHAVNAEHFLSETAVAAIDSYWAAVQAVNAEHFLSEVAVAGVDSYWAAVQAVSGRHCPPDSYLPVPHFEQTRSEVRLGATLSVSPVAHWLHAVHCAAFTVLLNLPAAHGLHVRSIAVVG